MKLKSIAPLQLALLNSLCIHLVLSQELPCPPPGAEALVDGENLAENCKCFYALAAAQRQDQSDTITQIKHHTVMHYAPAGSRQEHQYGGLLGLTPTPPPLTRRRWRARRHRCPEMPLLRPSSVVSLPCSTRPPPPLFPQGPQCDAAPPSAT